MHGYVAVTRIAKVDGILAWIGTSTRKIIVVVRLCVSPPAAWLGFVVALGGVFLW